MWRPAFFFALILFLCFLVSDALAFLPLCQTTDRLCEVKKEALLKGPFSTKEYKVTEIINTDPERDNRSKQLTRTFICLEEGYILKSRGEELEKITAHNEKKQLKAIVQEFMEHLKQIPNVNTEHYTITSIQVGGKEIGWIIRHNEGVEKIDLWIFKKKIIFATKFKSLAEVSGDASMED
ncbi:MAG TPA: hypothetical protein VMW81_02910 [Nitrospinota bacterium]|nr:hypothetical protein [Nitrospinota bacterium]